VGRNAVNSQCGKLGDDAGRCRGHHDDMSILPAKPKLTPEERRTRQADQLAPLRLRMAINYELDKRGITTPKALGAVLGMPRDEAISLLTRQYLREGDVALLEALAAQLGVQAPGS
jgi:hypothetical protein